MKQLRLAHSRAWELGYKETHPVTEDMITYMRALGNGMTPENVNSGLCGNFIQEFGLFMFNVIPRSKNKEFHGCNGNSEYPVPHPDYKFNKAPFTRYCQKELNMWEGAYGDNRREYCHWMADVMEEAYNVQTAS